MSRRLDYQIDGYHRQLRFNARKYMSEFNSGQFVKRIGRRLVVEFEDAGEAGTPGLIGAAREHPARVRLVKLLPAFVSVGSGLLIDSYGSQSKQQDIVLFERDFCPVYTINDAPEVTYYPIEAIAAVGEVKSTVSKSVLFDVGSCRVPGCCLAGEWLAVPTSC